MAIELLFERGWERLDWYGVLAIMLPWFLLAVFSVRTRLHLAFATHCLGAITAFTIMTLLLLMSEPDEFRNPGKMLLMVPVLGCFVGSHVSFPLSVLMLVILAFSPDGTKTK